jgi:hypothetical protein
MELDEQRKHSTFGNLNTINISNCPLIIYVSALGRVHVLDITNYSGIKDVNALSNVFHIIRNLNLIDNK